MLGKKDFCNELLELDEFSVLNLRNSGNSLQIFLPQKARSCLGRYYALNRQPLAPGLPDHRQTLTDALLAYTRDAAYAEFQEQQKGQLSPGMLADMVLLSADVFAIPSEAIGQVRPVLTMCDGRVVFEG